MEEFLPERRYCRFKERKSKRRTAMNNEEEDAANFKVNRFIQDVDKFLERNKKKRAKKEAKIHANISSLSKKGIYKNAVVSHPGLKALLNGSTIARLNGDLISLANKCPLTNKEDGDKQRENNDNSAGNVSPKSFVLNEERNNATELDTERNENNNLENIIQSECQKSSVNSPEIIRDDQITPENKDKSEFFSEKDITNVIPDTPEMPNLSPKVYCQEIFDLESPIEMKQFFEQLHKTPKKNTSRLHLLDKSPGESPKNEEFKNKVETGPQKVNNIFMSHAEPLLPKDYIYKFLPEEVNGTNLDLKKTILFNHGCVLREDRPQMQLQNERLKNNPVVHSKNCFRKRIPEEIKRSYRLSSFNDHYTLPNTMDDSNLFLNPLESMIPHVFNHRKDFLRLSPQKKTFFKFQKEPMNVENSYNRYKEEPRNNFRNDFMNTNVNKHLPEISNKEQFDQRKTIKFKDKLNARQRQYSMFGSCTRFKNKFKFSPHKYC